jgi:hypothetical protein
MHDGGDPRSLEVETHLHHHTFLPNSFIPKLTRTESSSVRRQYIYAACVMSKAKARTAPCVVRLLRRLAR